MAKIKMYWASTGLRIAFRWRLAIVAVTSSRLASAAEYKRITCVWWAGYYLVERMLIEIFWMRCDRESQLGTLHLLDLFLTTTNAGHRRWPKSAERNGRRPPLLLSSSSAFRGAYYSASIIRSIKRTFTFASSIPSTYLHWHSCKLPIFPAQ